MDQFLDYNYEEYRSKVLGNIWRSWEILHPLPPFTKNHVTKQRNKHSPATRSISIHRSTALLFLRSNRHSRSLRSAALPSAFFRLAAGAGAPVRLRPPSHVLDLGHVHRLLDHLLHRDMLNGHLAESPYSTGAGPCGVWCLMRGAGPTSKRTACSCSSGECAEHLKFECAANHKACVCGFGQGGRMDNQSG